MDFNILLANVESDNYIIHKEIKDLETDLIKNILISFGVVTFIFLFGVLI